jgi:hypothetical protein
MRFPSAARFERALAIAVLSWHGRTKRRDRDPGYYHLFRDDRRRKLTFGERMQATLRYLGFPRPDLVHQPLVKEYQQTELDAQIELDTKKRGRVSRS